MDYPIYFLAADEPLPLTVLQQNQDGSGVVRMPVLRTGRINLSRTSSSRDGKWEVTKETLAELVANFAQHPGPVPITMHPHRSFGETGGAMPGFIEKLEVVGDVLWANVFLTPGLFYEVKMGYWRGFSVDAAKDIEWPTVKMTGWSVIGGVLTNRPATDINFKVDHAVAAGAVIALDLLGGESPSEVEVSDMPETVQTVSLAQHETAIKEVRAEVSARDTQITNLTADLNRAKDELAQVRRDLETSKVELTNKEVELSRVNSLADARATQLKNSIKQLETLETKVLEAEQAKLAAMDEVVARNVKDIVKDAVAAGVPAALFDGHDTNTPDWLRARFASLEAFETHVKVLKTATRGRVASPPVKSGAEQIRQRQEAADDESKVKLEANEEQVFEQIGLETDFVGITNEAEARKVWEAKRKAAQARQ